MYAVPVLRITYTTRSAYASLREQEILICSRMQEQAMVCAVPGHRVTGSMRHPLVAHSDVVEELFAACVTKK